MAEQKLTAVIGADISEFTKAMKKISREMEKISDSITKEMTKAEDTVKESANNMNKHLESIGKGVKFSAITAGVSSLIPVLAVAGAGAMGLGSAFASAGAGAVGFGAVAVGVLNDVFEASEDLADIQEDMNNAKDAKEYAKALEKQQEVLAGLSDEQKRALKSLNKFKDGWGEFLKEFESPVVDIFGKSLDALSTILSKSKPMIMGVTEAVSRLIDSLNESLETEDMQNFFNWLGNTAGGYITTFGQAFGNVFKGVANLLVAFDPIAQSVADGFLKMTQKFAEWTSKLGSSKEFQAFFDYVNTNAPAVIGIIGNVASAMWDLVVKLAPVGQAVLGFVADTLEGIKNFSTNVSEAFTNQDWSGVGSAIGTGLGNAITGIVGLGQKLADKVVTEFNTLDWGTIAENMKAGITSFATSLAGFISTDLQDAMANGDWGKAGQILGDVIIQAINNVASRVGEFASTIGNVVLQIMQAVNWAQLGANSLFFIMGFILGVVNGLTDITLWWNFLKDNWDALLLAIVGLMFTPAKILGKIGEALAKIPIAGKFLSWLWNGLIQIIEPVKKWFDMWIGSIGLGIKDGFKKAFDGGGILADWLGKIGNLLSGVKQSFVNWFVKFDLDTYNFFVNLVQKITKPFKNFADDVGRFLIQITDDFVVKFNYTKSIVTSAMDNVKSTIKNAFSSASDGVKSFLSSIGNGFSNVWTTISGYVSKIKSAVGGMFKGIKTPHFSISGSMNPMKWEDEGMPKISVKWYETGGILDGSAGGSLIGMAENHGDEAILPLSKRSKFKPFASALADMIKDKEETKGGTTISNNFNISSIVIREEADIKRIAQELVKEQQKRSRAGGMVYYG